METIHTRAFTRRRLGRATAVTVAAGGALA